MYPLSPNGEAIVSGTFSNGTKTTFLYWYPTCQAGVHSYTTNACSY
jgi:hypothetical protein